VAAILDPAFEPSRTNTGSKQFPFIMDCMEQQIREFDSNDVESPLERSRSAETTLRFVCEVLGGEKVTEYLDDFFKSYWPALDDEEMEERPWELAADEGGEEEEEEA
jgi:hypothetical protein